MKIKILLPVIIITIFFSCKKERNNQMDNNLLVELEKKSDQGPFTSMLTPFSMVDTTLKGLKGIPDLDSVSVQLFRSKNKKKIEKLLNEKKIDSQEFDKLNYEMYAVSAIDKTEQILIFDWNRNKDFSDDEIQRFDVDIRNKTNEKQKVRDSFPLYEIPYYDFINNKLVKLDLRVRFVPIKDHIGFLEPTKEKNTYANLLIVKYKTQHWQGVFHMSDKDSISYKVGMADHWGRYQFTFREQNKPFYSRRNKDEQYEEFTIGDTLQLAKTIIKIDSVREDLNKVYLQKLNITSLPHGYKEGHSIRDYTFTDIEGNTKRISHLLRNKDLLLIDFWGTWCFPCLKLTPDLKQFHKDYPNVAMLGVDFDFEKEPGVKYIQEKELDWTHMYVERVRNDSLLHTKIVSKLRVDNYPTFMLIDKDLKIVYRGIGKKGLTRVEELIEVIYALKAQKRKKVNP